MKNKSLKILNFFLFLSVGILLLFFAFRGIDLNILVNELKTAEYFWVFLSLLFAFFGFIIRAYRWRLLIKPLGHYPGLRNTFYALMIGYLANFAFPRIGEVTRCGSLNKSDKIPLDSLFGTVIAERTVDVITMLILIIVIFFARINFFGNFLKTEIFNPAMNKITGIFDHSMLFWILFVVIFFSLAGWIFLCRKRLMDSPLCRKAGNILSGVGKGLITVFKMKRRSQFLLATILLWICYFLMTWVVFYALPATSNLKAIDGLFILVIGSIGVAIPVQGGIGTFHWIVTLGLTLYQIPREEALAFATISHESQSLFIILLGGISILILSLKRNKKTTII